ncbi:hypothetical protein RB597_002148 [Gaeumannomyces tritici]
MSAVAPTGPTPETVQEKTPSVEKTVPSTEKPVAAAAAPAAPGGTSGAPAVPAKKQSAAAEAKAKKQAEKAARRAQAIAAKTGPPGAGGPAPAADAPGGAAQPSQQGEGGKGGGKTKAKQEGGGATGASSSAQSGRGKPAASGAKSGALAPQADKEKKREAKPLVPACFAHIPVAKRIALPDVDRDVHPTVLALGQQMATFTLRENMDRLKGTLLAFKEVLRSYEAPAGNAFSRHFVPHVLNPQIEYLAACRPMCFAMGNAIRMIKTHVSGLDIDTSDKQAVESLCETIDTFIEEKVHYAEVIVTKNAAAMIADGDVVLTYGHHRLVRKAIQLARAAGRRFSVVVVEDPWGSGRDLAKLLRGGELLGVSYVPCLVELGSVLRAGTKVMLGVESVFANGTLYAPAGTSDVAAAASALALPVVALCESINVDRDRVAVEPLTYNEVDPDRCSEASFRLLFDTTREKHVSVLVTEYETETGNAPSASVLAILKKQEDPN